MKAVLMLLCLGGICLAEPSRTSLRVVTHLTELRIMKMERVVLENEDDSKTVTESYTTVRFIIISLYSGDKVLSSEGVMSFGKGYEITHLDSNDEVISHFEHLDELEDEDETLNITKA